MKPKTCILGIGAICVSTLFFGCVSNGTIESAMGSATNSAEAAGSAVNAMNSTVGTVRSGSTSASTSMTTGSSTGSLVVMEGSSSEDQLITRTTTTKTVTTKKPKVRYRKVRKEQPKVVVKQECPPPTARAGECYAMVTFATDYETRTERVLVDPGGRRNVEVPAEYYWVEEEVVPARYNTRTEREQVSSGGTVWKRNDEGIMCLVETPGEFRTVERKELIAPAQTRRVRKMIQPATTKMVDVQPTYNTVTRRVPVGVGRSECRRVLCELNTTPAQIRAVQNALRSAGFKPGIGGTLDAATKEAIKQYQIDKGLGYGHLTYETLGSLGVSVP